MQKIGAKYIFVTNKFANYLNIANIYDEYKYVFVTNIYGGRF